VGLEGGLINETLFDVPDHRLVTALYDLEIEATRLAPGQQDMLG